jgi:hypothetical protein
LKDIHELHLKFIENADTMNIDDFVNRGIDEYFKPVLRNIYLMSQTAPVKESNLAFMNFRFYIEYLKLVKPMNLITLVEASYYYKMKEE